MPSSASIKKLYLAKNVGELNKKAESNLPKVNNVERCLKSADKLYKQALLNDEKGDEELAYVQYIKFISFYSTIRKAKGYEASKDYCSAVLGNAPSEALKRAEELQANLIRRYALQEEATNLNLPQRKIIDEKIKDSFEVKGNKDSFKDPSSSIVLANDVEKDEKADESITSLKLYEMMNNSDIPLLILDARPSADFEYSHMKHNSCINVPEEILQPGTTAAALEKKLPAASLDWWKKRSFVDFVILLDWESSLSDLRIKHPLRVLSEAIYKWDQTNFLKSSPLILDGGYENWLLHYPVCTTNSSICHTSSHSFVPSLSDIKLDIDYPDLDKAFVETPEVSPVINLNTDQTAFHSDPLKNKIPQLNFPIVNRDSKPLKDGIHMNGNVTDDEIHSEVLKKVDSVTNIDKETYPKPTVDRKLKPKPSVNIAKLSELSHNAEADRKDSISQSLLKEESILEENIKVGTECLEKQMEFENLRNRKLYEAEEAMRLELQRQEEKLLAKVQELEQQAESKELEYRKVKEENDQIKQELNEVKGGETERLKNLEMREAHKRQLMEEVERLREERKIKEEKEAAKIKLNDTTYLPSTKSIDLQPQQQILRNVAKTINDTDMHADHTEHYVPLKDQSLTSTPTSHGGLSRSHSSPNIAQLVENEINQAFTPKFDRTLKPTRVSESFSPSVSRSLKIEELNAARKRNLQPVYGNQGQAVTGLRNLGNTCFMNAVIQCLGLSIPLSLYFTRGLYRNDIISDNKQSSKGEVAEEFAAVIWALWAGVYRSIVPRDFKNTVSKYLSVCVGYEQQDSHEFLIVLLEKLHGDLNKGKPAPLNQTLNLDDLPSEIAQQKFWCNHKRMNKSIISDLFEGLMQSTLKCLNCNKTSNSFEVLSFLSLPIPSNTRCSLNECLDLFLKAETMTGDGAWHCPQCKQKQEARKKMILCQLPEIMIIHLKRFSFEGMWRRKLQTYVDFPLELHMKQYVSQPPKNLSLSYKLYGVVNHYGTMEGGHYIAYCKNAAYDRWYKYDDHEVSPMPENEVKTSAAYILFYSCSDFRQHLEN